MSLLSEDFRKYIYDKEGINIYAEQKTTKWLGNHLSVSLIIIYIKSFITQINEFTSNIELYEGTIALSIIRYPTNYHFNNCNPIIQQLNNCIAENNIHILIQNGNYVDINQHPNLLIVITTNDIGKVIAIEKKEYNKMLDLSSILEEAVDIEEITDIINAYFIKRPQIKSAKPHYISN